MQEDPHFRFSKPQYCLCFLLTCRSVSRLLVSRTRARVASSSILSFSWVSFRQVICIWAEFRFCSPSLTSSWRWDTWGDNHSVDWDVSVCMETIRSCWSCVSAPVRADSYFLIGHVEFGRKLLFQVVELLLEAISLLLQWQPFNLKLLAHFLETGRKRERKKGTRLDEKTDEKSGKDNRTRNWASWLVLDHETRDLFYILPCLKCLCETNSQCMFSIWKCFLPVFLWYKLKVSKKNEEI